MTLLRVSVKDASGSLSQLLGTKRAKVRMVKQSPRTRSPRVQEHLEDAPTGWPDIQEELAASSGVSLLLVDGHQPPAVLVSHDHSNCQAFQSSPQHVKLCDPYCGE